MFQLHTTRMGCTGAALLALVIAAGNAWGQASPGATAKPEVAAIGDSNAPDAKAGKPAVGTSAASKPASDTPPATKPGAEADAPKQAKLDLKEWTTNENGCIVDQDGGKIHIAGVSSVDGWGHDNSVTSKKEFPVQDFEVSADLIIPRCKGPGQSIVYLRAEESNLSQVVVQYFPEGNCYMVRWWTKEGEAHGSTTLPKFGDEDTTVHRLMLKYDAATTEVTGYVDDKAICTMKYGFQSNIRFRMGVASDVKGYDVDTTFDRVRLVYEGKEVKEEAKVAETSPATQTAPK